MHLKTAIFHNLLLILLIVSCGQAPEPLQALEEHVETEEDLSVLFAEYIPENFAILKSATGDLNQDGIIDVALVLHNLGEDTIVPVGRDYVPRPLLLLLKNEKGEYSLVFQNDKVVYCCDCGGIFGDPFYEIDIVDGLFTIYHYGGSNWRWTRDLTFKYDKTSQDWYLHLDQETSFSVFEQDEVESSVKTVQDFGKIRFVEFDAFLDYGDE